MKSLELLAPKGLWLLGLLAPLVVLYILKIKREKKKVASTWLWATARRDLLARSPFKKLVAEVPLLLEALAVIALALALARPATRGGGLAGEHVAIVIDTSASMSALSIEGGEKVSRIELACRAAKDLLLSLGPGADAMVFEAGRDTRILAPLDRDLLRVQRSFEKLEARDVEGDLGAAIALAVDRLRQMSGARRIVVFTDGNLAHPEALGAPALPIEIVKVGSAVENTAIVRVDVRSGNDEGTKEEQVQAFLLIANFGLKPREIYVTMREHNTTDVLASRRVLVQPGERLPVVLTFHPTRGDYDKGLVFDLAPHDAMPVDDVAYGRVPAGDKLPAFLAGATPSPWLERALVSDPMLELKKGSVGDLSASASVDQGTLVVVDGACPKDPPGGDLLVVHPPAGRCYGTEVGKVLEQPVVTSWDNGDPRLRFLTLDGLHFAHPNRLTPEGAAQELVRTQDGPIATDGSTPARTVTLLGFDVGESDWPLKASYVLFMRNVIELARAHRAHGVTGPARAGEPMRVSIPAGATDVKATGTRGEPVEVSVRGGVAVLPEIQRAGFYQVSWAGAHPGSVLVPANLTSAAESDLTPRALPKSSGVSVLSAADAKPDAHTEWSWLLALFALALVLADVAYITRSPRRGAVATPARPRVPDRARRAA